MANENRGSNGQVGESSAGDRVKARHRKEGSGKSLKQFARDLVNKGDQDATDWFAAKAGALELSRSDKTKARITLEKSASKLAKSAKKK